MATWVSVMVTLARARRLHRSSLPALKRFKGEGGISCQGQTNSKRNLIAMASNLRARASKIYVVLGQCVFLQNQRLPHEMVV